MIAGITATLDDDETPAAYTAQAVQFTGLSGTHGQCGLKCASLSCTDNGFMSWSGWFLISSWHGQSGLYAFMSDSHGAYQPYFYNGGEWTYRAPNMDGYTHQSNPLLVDGDWVHLMGAADVNQPPNFTSTPPNKKVTIYASGMFALDLNDIDNQPATTFTMSGKDFWVGDDGFGDSFAMYLADFSVWPGVNFATSGTSTIPPETIALFRDGNGKPVDPSVAVAALGTPAIMCTGGLAGFLANSLGGSGPLTVPAGYDSPLDTALHP